MSEQNETAPRKGVVARVGWQSARRREEHPLQCSAHRGQPAINPIMATYGLFLADVTA
jgi:hypothetical protein